MDFELVGFSRADPGEEHIPESARWVEAHRVTPSVPVVERPHDTHGASIGRPDSEADALHSLERQRMRPKFGVGFQVRAFSQQVTVDLTQHRRKAIRVLDLHAALRRSEPQPIWNRARDLENPRKESRGFALRQFAEHRSAFRLHDSDRLCPRKETTDHHPARRRVHPEISKGITQLSLPQRLQRAGFRDVHDFFGAASADSAPPRSCTTAWSGIDNQAGRLASS